MVVLKIQNHNIQKTTAAYPDYSDMRRFCLSAPEHIIYIVCVSYYSSKAFGFESVLSEE